MFRLLGPKSRLCDGLPRREFLRVGGLGLAGLTLPDLLRLQASAAHSGATRRKVRSVVQLFMWGGPAQHETFDLKPNAPEGIRGEFKPIDTNVPGIRITEHLPRLASIADKFAIVRSVTHTGVNHGTSAYHMLTGHIHFSPGTLRHPTPNDYPHVGSAVARYGPKPLGVPSYVALPSVLLDGDGGEVPGQGPGFLGNKSAPFTVVGDPTRRDFAIETLELPGDIDRRRFAGRVGLRAALDRHAEQLSRTAAANIDAPYEEAFRLMQSPATRRAFRLASEPDAVRDRYGWHTFGQSVLLARRLVEAGVPMITVYWNAPHIDNDNHWDTHRDSFRRLREVLLPPFDQAMSALLTDLDQRGLLDQTLITWGGEFGRTPKLNRNGGRDHWGFCQSMVLAGGGVKGGQVYGSSDGSAAYAAEKPVSPDDLAATVFDRLGVPLTTELQDAQGRPLPLCLGRPIEGLF